MDSYAYRRLSVCWVLPVTGVVCFELIVEFDCFLISITAANPWRNISLRSVSPSSLRVAREFLASAISSSCIPVLSRVRQRLLDELFLDSFSAFRIPRSSTYAESSNLQTIFTGRGFFCCCEKNTNSKALAFLCTFSDIMHEKISLAKDKGFLLKGEALSRGSAC